MEKTNTIQRQKVIQSYIITSAKYNFTIYEKRILYRIIEALQINIENDDYDNPVVIKEVGTGDYVGEKEITIPVNHILKDEKDENYNEVKKALTSMHRKYISYETDEGWSEYTLIFKPKMNKDRHYVKFRLNEEIYRAILDFSKGFCKYELKIAMQFKSIYSMRLYELLSGKNEPIMYKIDNLKKMFLLEKKYKNTADFINCVIAPAKKELDQKAPFTFEYKLRKTKVGYRRKYSIIIFMPIIKNETKKTDIQTAFTVTINDKGKTGKKQYEYFVPHNFEALKTKLLQYKNSNDPNNGFKLEQFLDSLQANEKEMFYEWYENFTITDKRELGWVWYEYQIKYNISKDKNLIYR